LSVTVQPIPVGSTAEVGKLPSDQWIVASESGASSQPLSTNSSSVIGPLQIIGTGFATGPGPFTVHRPDLASGTIVTGTTWITTPGLAAGAKSGVRLPVRFQALPTTITLYVGTVAGAGRMTVSVHATTGEPLELPVDLPTCSASSCPSVVTITIASSPGSSATSSGDAVVDLTAIAPTARVGFAGASLR
jgi:hypothetical protein